MFYSSNREALRQKFFDAYNKFTNRHPLESVESQILSVIQAHPEYSEIFEKQAYYLTKDYNVELGETNPFLHMSSHIGLHEQLSTNRPKGITKIYHTLIQSGKHAPHDIEHHMIEIMMENIWQAQRDNVMPDDKLYLKKLKKLIKTL